MAYILLLESSTTICSVALSHDGKVIASKDSMDGQRHSKWMTVFVQDLLAEASLKINQLDAVAVSSGPGSYTGLRVAYSIAKGIAFRLDIPILEIPTLEALGTSYQVEGEEPHCVIATIDARRMEVYWRVTDEKGLCIQETEAHIYAETSFDRFLSYDSIYVVGDGAEKISEIGVDSHVMKKITVIEHLTLAANLSKIAYSKFTVGDFADVAYCTPFYLKSPRVTQSKKII